MNRSLNLLFLTSFSLLPFAAAHAGKAERDFQSGTVDPMVQEARANIKKSCGCDVKFDVRSDTFRNVDELYQAKNFANLVHEKVSGSCNDAPGKAAMCRMKTLELSKASQTGFRLDGGKGIATTNGSSFPSWDMLISAVDK